MRYDFLNNETGEIEEHQMSYKDLDQFKEDNPHLKQVILSAPDTVGGHGDRVKTDAGFKEVLSKVSEAHPDSNLAKRHGNNKSIKDMKTRSIVEKHVAIQNKKK